MYIVKFIVKFICSGIYIFLTRILQSLVKQQEAYLVHQKWERGKGTNLARLLEHFAAKWYLYGSLRMTALQRANKQVQDQQSHKHVFPSFSPCQPLL